MRPVRAPRPIPLRPVLPAQAAVAGAGAGSARPVRRGSPVPARIGAAVLAACLGGLSAVPAGAARTPGNRLQAESQLPLRAVYCTVPLRQQLQGARAEAAASRPGSPARAAQAARAERIADRLHAVNAYLGPRLRAIDDRYEQAALRRGQADLAESLREARVCLQRCEAATPHAGRSGRAGPSPGRAACTARCDEAAGPANRRIDRCMDPDLLRD